MDEEFNRIYEESYKSPTGDPLREMAIGRQAYIDMLRNEHVWVIAAHYTRLAAASEKYDPTVGHRVTGHLRYSVNKWKKGILGNVRKMHRRMAGEIQLTGGKMPSVWLGTLNGMAIPAAPIPYEGDWRASHMPVIRKELEHSTTELAHAPKTLPMLLEDLAREMDANPGWSYPLVEWLQTKVIVNGKVNDNMVEDMAELLSVFHD